MEYLQFLSGITIITSKEQMAQVQLQISAEMHSYSPNAKPNPQQVLSSRNGPSKVFKKKIFKRKRTLQHRVARSTTVEMSPYLNFHGLMCVNEEAMKDGHVGGSHLSSHFAHQQVKSVEMTDKFIVIHLSNPHACPTSVSQTICRYSSSQDSRLQQLGKILINLEQIIQSTPTPPIASVTEQFWHMLARLGDLPFLCKPPKPLLLWGYDSDYFALQCLNFRQPLYDGFTNGAYQAVLKKQAENLLMAASQLKQNEPWGQGSRPQTTLVYRDYLKTRQNDSLLCRMKLSMPLPMVHLIQVEKVLESIPVFKEQPSVWSDQAVRSYCGAIRQKSYKSLHNLTDLQENYDPKNYTHVAGYLEKPVGENDDSQKEDYGQSSGSG